MNIFFGVAVWVVFALIRALLWVIGWFFVPLTLIADGARRTPPLWRPVYGNIEDAPAEYRATRWKSYVWMAWRNPTNGLKGYVKQPVPEEKPNPDHNVRIEGWPSDSRFMQSGIFWEYWYLRSINLGKYKWFEFRIGWKFVDGNAEFFPTFQLGPRSS